ncbi:MAG: hypothetical protein H7343_06095 [Undibacterium sp.]|nr:hypothetical protein [Opitutaceae bacterium]
MTATKFIRELQQLPAKERRKVFAYVGASIAKREDASDRRAVTASRRDRAPAIPLSDLKRQLGLA